MRQVIVSCFIFAPTPADLSAQDGKGFLRGLASWISNREAISLLFQASHFRFELVNLATQAGLSPIERASIQEERTPDLLA
jgi:hypothetical protein